MSKNQQIVIFIILIAITVLIIAGIVFVRVVCPIKYYNQICPIKLVNRSDDSSDVFRRNQTKLLLTNSPVEIAEINRLCILEAGDKFNKNCENQEVVINNLYLYPLNQDENLSQHFYLYSSKIFGYTTPNIITGDPLLAKDSFLIAFAENAALLKQIENKAQAVNNPVVVNIEGNIKSSQNCAGECKYGFTILMKKISFMDF